MMDQLISGLKYIAAFLAAIVATIKLFTGLRLHSRHLENRHRRIKAFFDEGGADRHPLLVESAFGAAMGHDKFDAQEVPLLLRQEKPTAFMATYLRVRNYLSPDSEGVRFELRGLAAKPVWRRTAIGLGLLLYGLFVWASVWLLYASTQMVIDEAWSKFFSIISLSAFFAAFAAYCLIQASHVHWAVKLFDTQK